MRKERFRLIKLQPRIGATFLFFLLFQVVLFIILSFSSINVQYLGQNLQNRISQNSQPFDDVFLSIFLNNVKIATIEVIPVLGTIFLFLVTVNTGMTISSYAVETHASAFTILHLYLLPATFVELSAYSIGAVLNLYILIRMIIMRQRSDRAILNALQFYGLMVLILIIAALFETAEIKYPLYLGTYFSLYWIFAVPVIILLFLLYWYFIRPNLSSREALMDERQYRWQ